MTIQSSDKAKAPESKSPNEPDADLLLRDKVDRLYRATSSLFNAASLAHILICDKQEQLPENIILMVRETLKAYDRYWEVKKELQDDISHWVGKRTRFGRSSFYEASAREDIEQYGIEIWDLLHRASEKVFPNGAILTHSMAMNAKDATRFIHALRRSLLARFPDWPIDELQGDAAQLTQDLEAEWEKTIVGLGGKGTKAEMTTANKALIVDRAKEYINKHHGCTNSELAMGIDCSVNTIKRHTAKQLKVCKYTNRGRGKGGWYPPGWEGEHKVAKVAP